jgi:hypothetical protein
MKMTNTLASLFAEYSTEIYALRETGDLDDDLYQSTLQYLMDNNEIPYGTATARDGDPYNFVCDFLMEGYN